MSGDGNSAVIAGSGGVYIFHHSGASWTQQVEFTGVTRPVAISSDGSTALADSVTGCGAAFLFTRTGTQWTQKQTLTAAADADGEGTVTAISANDGVAMAAVNGPEDAYGTVYVFS
jgi:hypothetical protein